MIDRRSLLLSPLAAAILPRKTYAAQLASLHGRSTANWVFVPSLMQRAPTPR